MSAGNVPAPVFAAGRQQRSISPRRWPPRGVHPGATDDCNASIRNRPDKLGLGQSLGESPSDGEPAFLHGSEKGPTIRRQHALRASSVTSGASPASLKTVNRHPDCPFWLVYGCHRVARRICPRRFNAVLRRSLHRPPNKWQTVAHGIEVSYKSTPIE